MCTRSVAWARRPSRTATCARRSGRPRSRGIENEARGTYGSDGLLLAPGLIFGKVITVNPFLSLPVGVRGAKHVTGVSFAISFGSKQ